MKEEEVKGELLEKVSDGRGIGESLERIWKSVLVGLLAGSQAALGVFEGGDMCPHPPSSIEVMPGSSMGNLRWRCSDCGQEFDEDPYGEG